MALKKIYTAQNLQEASVIKDELALEGIDCKIQGFNLDALKGRLPAADSLPTVWVEETQVEKALQTLDLLKKQQESEYTPWVCKNCGEDNEGQFAVCWKCGEHA